MLFNNVILIFLLMTCLSFAQTTLTCNSTDDVMTVLNANGDISCQTSWGSYTKDSDATAQAKAQASSAQEAQKALPQYTFSDDLFAEQLAGSPLATDINVLPYYAPLKDLAHYKNFTGMKGMLALLLGNQKITQTEVDQINAVLMQQNIDLSKF